MSEQKLVPAPPQNIPKPRDLARSERVDPRSAPVAPAWSWPPSSWASVALQQKNMDFVDKHDVVDKYDMIWYDMLWYDVILYIYAFIYLSIYDMIFLILYKNMIYDMIWYDVVDKYQMLSHDSWLSWLFIVGGCTTDVFCFWCSTIGIRNRNMGWDSVFLGNDLRNCGIFSASHVHVPMANGFF